MKCIVWALVAAALSIASLAEAQVVKPRNGATCTHYVSSAGGGNGSSVAAPMTVSAFWSAASAGTVGCLMDGTYTNIQPPTGKTGPITLRAMNDGKVLVDLGGSRQVFINAGRDLTFEGMDICCSKLGGGGNGVGVNIYASTNTTLRRVAVWNGGDQDVVNWDSTGTVLEDAALFGQASAPVNDNGTVFNTVHRRLWASWDGFCPPGPTTMRAIYVFAYLQYATKPTTRSHLLSENTIYKWDARGNAGCQNGDPFSSGSWSAGIYHRDVYDNHTGELDRFRNGIVFSIAASNFPQPGGGLMQLQGSRNDTEQTKFIVDKDGAATGVFAAMCRKLVNGVDTGPLWPWPMDARIKAARARAGLPMLPGDGTVTGEMQSRYGAIPAECTGGSVPPPVQGPTMAAAQIPADPRWVRIQWEGMTNYAITDRVELWAPGATVRTDAFSMADPPSYVVIEKQGPDGGAAYAAWSDPKVTYEFRYFQGNTERAKTPQVKVTPPAPPAVGKTCPCTYVIKSQTMEVTYSDGSKETVTITPGPIAQTPLRSPRGQMPPQIGPR